MKNTIALVSFALLAAAGCTTVNTVENGQPVAQRQMIADRRVITDASLNRAVRIVGVNAATGTEGFLKVQVEVQNTTRTQKAFTYRVEWFDENAMIINLPTSASIPWTLQGMESSMITVTAPTPRAKDFRIKFLEPMN